MVFSTLLLGAFAFAQDLPPPAPPDLPSPPPAPPSPPPAPGSPGGQVFAGLMNPAISINALGLASATWEDGTLLPPTLGGHAAEQDPGADPHAHGGEGFGTGLQLQETEVVFKAAVDPYFTGQFVLAMHGIEGIEIEEGFVTLTSIPRVLVNLGKFKVPFGRENLAHTHALLTIDRSLVGQAILGGEGLNDVGANAAVLLPTPWFSELTLGVDAGNNEVLFGSGKPLGLGTSAHWKNLVDFDTVTAELGVSGLTGLNAFDGRTYAGGVDFTLRGRGRGAAQWRRFIWQTEYLFATRGGATEDATFGGLYSTVEVSLNRRFWLGGRFDFLGLPEAEPGERTLAGTGIAVFAPSEFSAVRLQYQRQWPNGGHPTDTVLLQLNYTLGAHAAHGY